MTPNSLLDNSIFLGLAKSLSLALSALLLFGCASTSSVSTNAKDAISGEEDDYRASEKTLVRSLETPPDLFSPETRQDGFSKILAQTENQAEARFIPTYRAKGVQVKQNLLERWLEVQTRDSQTVWRAMEAYFATIGMPIQEARKDIGLMKTEFTPRNEIVPLDSLPGLTRVLNSWRPEIADGVLDRFIVQIESVAEESVVRVYFRHHQLWNGSENAGLGGWKIRPFDVRMESEALYESMIFFGATELAAQQAVQASEYLITTTSDEEQEFAGVRLRATLESSWQYLAGMVYRADWSIEEMNQADHRFIIQLPDQAADEGLWSNLAFWQNKAVVSKWPKKLILKLKADEQDGELSTLVMPSVLEGDVPLNAETKQSIFQSLGLLDQSVAQAD